MKEDTKVRIPEEYVNAFNEFLTMKVEKREEFISALRKTRIELTSSRIANTIASKIQVPAKKLQNIIEMFLSLYAFIETNRISVSEVVDDLKKSAEEIGITAKESDRNSFQKHLGELVTNKDESFGLINKALQLYSEYQNLFLDARILTDLRPIFKSNLKEGPAGGIIVHNLKVIYQSKHDSRSQEIFLALDSTDLDTLIKVLERAKEKAENLYNCINQNIFPCIEYQEEE